MPTYEYKCDRCGVFEYRQSFSDPTLERCPTCGSPVKRMISRNVNVIYKAAGFYVSDHRSSEYKASASKDSDNSSTGKSTGDSPAAGKAAE
ncbi:MAG: FmdB family zinc ribbon protein [Chloroflexota bacterium]